MTVQFRSKKKRRFERKKLLFFLWKASTYSPMTLQFRNKKKRRFERNKLLFLFIKWVNLFTCDPPSESWPRDEEWPASGICKKVIKNKLKNNKNIIIFFWHYKTFYSLILENIWNGICNKVIRKFVFVILNILLFNFWRSLKM